MLPGRMNSAFPGHHGYVQDRIVWGQKLRRQILRSQILQGQDSRAHESGRPNTRNARYFGNSRHLKLLFFKKKVGKLTGWISYTLSRTELKLDGVNNGNWYPARQDRTHDISLVGIYQAGKKWTLSATWVYYTGNAVTFPSGKYQVDGQTAFYYTERNAYRMPAYHRMDVAATLQGKKTKKFESSWTFSVYNLYGRENAYSIVFQNDPNDPEKTQALQYALFRFIPSVTYNFKF